MTTGGFNSREFFVIAREMEEEGLAFYKAVAKQVGDPDAKATFLKLASDEIQHVRDLARLEERGGEFFPSEDDSLVAQYIHSIVDTKVFPPLAEVPRIAASAKGVAKAIDFGIGAEKRAMDFYAKAESEAGDAEAVKTLARLRAEEEKHLVMLNALRRNFA
jgi:rubrerythrin